MKKKRIDKNEVAKGCGNLDNREWLEWLKKVMLNRPKNNSYLDSKRGFEVGRLCLEVEKELFSWRRGEPDIFWIDVQLFTKYKLSDKDIIFILKMQPGIKSYKDNAKEKNAYAEMMRGLGKLKAINIERELFEGCNEKGK